jgi:hypothetical protein
MTDATVPVPPNQKFMNSLLLINIFKILKNTVIKAFRIGNQIGSGENCGGTEGKSDLSMETTQLNGLPTD